MSDVSFKIVLQDKKRPETKHRFRGDFTYAQLTDLLSHLWGGKKRLVVEYVDDEGDDILVLTEVEWQECVRLHLKHQEECGVNTLPLALRVRQEKKVLCSKKNHHHRRQVKEATADVAAVTTVPTAAHVDVNASAISSDYDSDSDEGHAYVTPSESSAIRRSAMNRSSSAMGSTNTSMHVAPSGEHPLGTSSTVPPAAVKTADEASGATPAAAAEDTQPPKFSADDHVIDVVPRLHLSAIGRPMNRQSTSDVTDNVDDAGLMSLLSLIFNCDAALELYHPSVQPSPLSAVMSTPAQKDEHGQVHVDIDLQRVKKLAIAKANERMDTDPTQSRAILEAALQHFGNDPLVLYNLSCAAACERNNETAMMWLESALVAGYCSYETISVDHDFDNIRSEARFQTLMNVFFPESIINSPKASAAPAAAPAAIAVSDPATSSISVPAPVPVVDVTVIPAATPRTNTVMSVFPNMSQKEAKSLLSLANNNVNVAIDWKLGQQ
jgi:hypothetical protein